MNKLKILLVLTLLSLFVLSACNSDDDKNNDNDTKPTVEAVDVSLQMSWIHEYSSAPLYLAEKNGHFKEEGLNVQLIEGGFNESGFIDSIEQVVNGSSQFGLADSFSLINARQAGKPVVAILTILQTSPDSLISLAENDIVRPQDLAGHTVAVSDGGARLQYDNLLSNLAIDPTTIDTISRTTFGVDPIVNGEVDVVAGWIINEGVELQEGGHATNIILLSDYGVDSYPFTIFTTDEIVKNQPEMVQHFVNAVIKGMQDTVSDPAQAITYTLTYNDTLPEAGQLSRLQTMIPLMNVPNINLGLMRTDVWNGSLEVMTSQDENLATFDLESVYTNQFVDAYYAQ